MCRALGIVHHIIGLHAFPFQRILALFARLQLFQAPSAAFQNAFVSFLVRHVDKNHSIAQLTPAGFEQQRRIEHNELDARLQSGGGNFVFQPFCDTWMNNRFQRGPGCLLLRTRAENQRTHTTTINFAIGVENTVTERLKDLPFDGILFQHQMTGSVSFNNRDIMFFL